MSNKEREEVIKSLTKAIKVNPHDADAYFKRGIALKDFRMIEEAIRDFTKAISLNSNFAAAYYQRGIAFYEVGKKMNP